VLLYLRQEGRGIGLLNKIRAYRLQDAGADTVDANHQLGLPADLREYGIAADMFTHLGIRELKLMTNNPRKIAAMQGLAISAERIAHVTTSTDHNAHYLATKASKLGHLLNHAPAHADTPAED